MQLRIKSTSNIATLPLVAPMLQMGLVATLKS